MSVDSFVAERALFLAISCLEYGDKPMNCAHCGTAIKWEWAFISGHGWLTFVAAPGKPFGSIFRIAPDANRHPAPPAVSISVMVRMWLHN